MRRWSAQSVKKIQKIADGVARAAKALRILAGIAAKATDSVPFFVTGGVSFCSSVDAPEVLDSEPKVTPPSLVSTPYDVTSASFPTTAPRPDKL